MEDYRLVFIKYIDFLKIIFFLKFSQSFLLNPTTGKEVTPILVAHEPLPCSSTPRESPKPHITMNPSETTPPSTTIPSSSSGYVTAPSSSNLQVNGNGYVTPSMFSVRQFLYLVDLNFMMP